MKSFYFVLVMSLPFMQIGRKVGWSLSKNILYRFDVSLNKALLLALGWALLVFALDVALINVFQPHWAIKWIFGYALGMYVASPNFGLVSESTIPDGIALDRHNMIKNLPQALFLVSVVIYEIVLNVF